ncbi:hypothetical protein A4S06_02255 [Erysipelotrichaceae bacterium MTC7]|nr:hypothetical protein A4S06_02255 [Erysipelotrichaceae bacterium MTC7]
MTKHVNWVLFRSFVIAGTFTFAGGLAMLPLLQKEIVDKHKLMNKDEFLEDAIMAQTLPGIIALNSACFVGKKSNGISGMIAAALGSILPAFVFMLLATILYAYIPQEGPLQTAFVGIRASAVAFIFAAAISIGQHALNHKVNWLIMILSFLVIVVFNFQAPYVILFAGIFGIIYYSYIKKEGGKV